MIHQDLTLKFCHPKTLSESNGSSSRMAEAGLYFAWGINVFRFCPQFFSSLQQLCILGTSEWRVSRENLFLRTPENSVSQGYRKWEVVPRIQSGTLSPQPCLHSSPLSTEGTGKLWLFIHSSLYPPLCLFWQSS